jgi:hypothetical protein
MSHEMMLHDGEVAVTWESIAGIVRVLDHVPVGPHPDYVAVGVVMRLSPDIVKLAGFSGRLNRQQMWLIARMLLGQGFKVAYVDRAAGRIMPNGEQITSGDWVGFWRVDLTQATERRRGPRAATEVRDE